jgi:hypothetical protein
MVNAALRGWRDVVRGETLLAGLGSLNGLSHFPAEIACVGALSACSSTRFELFSRKTRPI